MGPQHHSTGLRNLARANGTRPLKEDHFRICVRLAEGLERFTRNAGHALPPQLTLPDAGCVMRPTTELYYTNADLATWIREEEVPAGMYAIHGDLSPIAAQLLVRSLRDLHEVGHGVMRVSHSWIYRGGGMRRFNDLWRH